jgi:hypothetical protein
MPVNNEDELRALWRNQATASLRISPEQLRERARKFDSQARHRYMSNQVCWVLLVFVFGLAALLMPGGLLFQLGCALLALWALWCGYGERRWGSVLPGPPELSAVSVQSCALHYRAQLVRQRNIVLSWPLGIGLAAPGFFVYCLGFPLGPKPLPWAGAIALMGVGTFVGLAGVIYGKILAGQWQEDLDALDYSMSVGKQPPPDVR